MFVLCFWFIAAYYVESLVECHVLAISLQVGWAYSSFPISVLFPQCFSMTSALDWSLIITDLPEQIIIEYLFQVYNIVYWRSARQDKKLFGTSLLSIDLLPEASASFFSLSIWTWSKLNVACPVAPLLHCSFIHLAIDQNRLDEIRDLRYYVAWIALNWANSLSLSSRVYKWPFLDHNINGTNRILWNQENIPQRCGL